MKNKDLIHELQKLDPDKEVMIQQGEDYDYMAVYSVKEKEVINMESTDDDEEISAIVIEYQ